MFGHTSKIAKIKCVKMITFMQTCRQTYQENVHSENTVSAIHLITKELESISLRLYTFQEQENISRGDYHGSSKLTLNPSPF